MDPLRIGVIGCGNISGIYFKNLKTYRSTAVVACADLDLARAKHAAAEYGIAKAVTPDELIADPEIELVLNLTIPKAHGPVALQAVQAGKHVYNEKPLCANRAEAECLLEAAEENGVLVGCAPDTVLGAGIQTCRKLIDDGLIGRPVAAQAAMLSHGPEGWHPAPEFFFKPGGGPMLDMGPYYLSALVTLLGSVKRVTGSTAVSFPQRPIRKTNKNYYGKDAEEVLAEDLIEVETPTHFAGVLDMADGAVVELTTSFDVFGEWTKNPITIYGSEGTLKVPDPNTFGGPVLLRKAYEQEWTEIPLEHGFAENSRGLGVLDLAYAARNGGTPRASGRLAYHVLDVMLSFQQSSEQERHIHPQSGLDRPTPMAVNEYGDEGC